MTRINAGIHPAELPSKLLIAENREILRVPELANKALLKPANFLGTPEVFCLGTGHVKFFYKRQTYIFRRYKAILAECKRRGFTVTDYSFILEDRKPDILWHDWTATPEARALLVERIVTEKGFTLLPLPERFEGHSL